MKTVNLTLSHDAARANWGGDWRMPTYDEYNELITKCTWKLTVQNGVDGFVVTSKTNGNSIFLPLAGEKWGENHNSAKDVGTCWSSTYSTGTWEGGESTHYFSFGCNFSWGLYEMVECSRYAGLTIRPVIRK